MVRPGSPGTGKVVGGIAKSMKVISVFGGSSPRPGDHAYREAYELGALLARAGFTAANGGYCGTMEAVSRGAAEAGGTVIGVTCTRLEQYRPVGPNSWLTEQLRVETLSERLKRLVEIGDGYAALPGGIGTMAEIAQTWSWIQAGEIKPGPLVLVGSMWSDVLEAFHAKASAGNYLAVRDWKRLRFEPDVEQAVRFLEAVRDHPSGFEDTHYNSAKPGR